MNESAEADVAPSPAGEGGLGARLNRLMQAAETEAAQVREAAERRAAALLAEAHAEIARHEQDRRREWQEHEAALAAAEQRVAVELTEAREQAVQLAEAAEHEAQSIRGQAHLRAREINDAAEESIEQLRCNAAQELERLTTLRDATRAEIQRLLRSLDGVRDALAYELDAAVPGGSAPTPSKTATAVEGSAVPQPIAAAAAIGRRRGDIHRARLSGLSTPVTDRTGGLGPA
jgi:hypothetical protein